MIGLAGPQTLQMFCPAVIARTVNESSLSSALLDESAVNLTSHVYGRVARADLLTRANCRRRSVRASPHPGGEPRAD
jgi:hypothetical protein